MNRFIHFVLYSIVSSTFIFGQDITPPVITCPANISLSNANQICARNATFAATATDDSQILSGNILLNGDAELNNTSSWTLTNGGNGWAVTTEAPHSGTYAFIGSYGMGTMTQVLDLVTMGYSTSTLDVSPDVNVSEWYKASACCSANDSYFYRAELLDQSMTVIATFNLGSETATVNSTSVWQQVQHTFTGYPAGMRFIRIVHGSTDQEFWAGNYGTVIDDSEVSMMTGDVTITYSQNPGTSFPVGTTVVTATATDGSGNTATCDFNVTINDTQGPAVPTLSTLTGQCSVDNVLVPVATDNCTGQVIATTNSSLVFNQQGTYSITWNYVDGNGNTSTQNQTVIVYDNMGPTPDLANLPDIVAMCSAVAPTAPTAMDNCTGAVTGTTTTQFPITTPGTTVVIWTFVDAHNNTSTQTQNVIISGVENGVTQAGSQLNATNPNATYAWIDCSDNSLIAQANGQSYTATANGSYAVILTEGGCTDTSDCVLIAGVGLNELDQTQLSIFPNPSTDGNFVITSDVKIIAVELYDNAGRFIQRIEKSANNKLEFSIANSGVYSAKIELENATIVRRIENQKGK